MFNRKKITNLGAVLLTCLLPTLALASDGGAHHAEHADGVIGLTMQLKMFWFNFLLYVGLLYLLVGKKFKSAWLTRREGIASRINAAKAKLDASDAELSSSQSKINSLQKEIEQLNSNIKNETVRECAEIVENAKTRATRVLAQADDSAKAEQRAAEIAIRKEVGEMVIKLATERLKKESNLESDKGYRENSLRGASSLVH